MDATEPSLPPEGFGKSAYVFITFLYAAAVHLIIAKAHDSTLVDPKSASVLFQVIVLALILFLLSDWASRARLPRLLPESADIPGYLYVWKIIFEVIGVYFLVSAFLMMMVKHSERSTIDGSDPLVAGFGMFLVATASWNYLMIYIMKELDVPSLIRAVCRTGSAIDMEKTRREYLGPFDDWKAKQEQLLEEAVQHLKDQLSSDPQHATKHTIHWAIVDLKTRGHARLFEGVIASLSQFLANHVLYANAVAGGALIFHSLYSGRTVLDALSGLLGEHSSLFYGRLELNPTFAIISIILAMLACIVALRRPLVYFLCALVVAVAFGTTLVVPNADEWLSLSGVIALIFLASSLCYTFRCTRAAKTTNRIGGFVILVPLVILYLCLPPYLLISMLAGQQVLANIFLQFSVRRSTEIPVLT